MVLPAVSRAFPADVCLDRGLFESSSRHADAAAFVLHREPLYTRLQQRLLPCHLSGPCDTYLVQHSYYIGRGLEETNRLLLTTYNHAAAPISLAVQLVGGQK